MSGRFQRGLSKALLQDLLVGPCKTVFQACLGAGLDVRLRNNYLNAYFLGRSLARIRGRRLPPARLEIHHKYLVDDRLGGCVGRRTGHYCVFDLDATLARVYAANLDTLIERARAYAGPEEDVELRLLQRNDSTAFVCCFDRQILVPHTPGALDLVGLLADPEPVLVAIEVKCFPDNSIQKVPLQLNRYLEILDPTQQGLRDDVARSYRTVCKQLRALGLPAPEPARISEGMPVKGLVIVSDYNPRSELLPRAHKLATTLDRPIHLWQPKDGEFLIPSSERWVRMGLE